MIVCDGFFLVFSLLNIFYFIVFIVSLSDISAGNSLSVPQYSVVLFFTGRPARSAAMQVLFLLNGPKMGFSPRRGDTLPR